MGTTQPSTRCATKPTSLCTSLMPRPGDDASSRGVGSGRRTHSAYFVHDADPLVSLADAWGGYFQGTSPVGELEIVASETLARWRAGSIEFPDYYLVFSAEDWPTPPALVPRGARRRRHIPGRYSQAGSRSGLQAGRVASRAVVAGPRPPGGRDRTAATRPSRSAHGCETGGQRFGNAAAGYTSQSDRRTSDGVEQWLSGPGRGGARYRSAVLPDLVILSVGGDQHV